MVLLKPLDGLKFSFLEVNVRIFYDPTHAARVTLGVVHAKSRACAAVQRQISYLGPSCF